MYWTKGISDKEYNMYI